MKSFLSKYFIVIGIALIILVSGLVIFFSKINQSIPEEEIGIPQEGLEREVALIINYGEGLPKTFEAEFKEGLTVFDLLKNKTEELNMVFEAEIYDFGTLITAIGDKKNGEDGKYWLYYVNEEMPMIAADKKEIKPGDKIEFKFEESHF